MQQEGLSFEDIEESLGFHAAGPQAALRWIASGFFSLTSAMGTQRTSFTNIWDVRLPACAGRKYLTSTWTLRI